MSISFYEIDPKYINYLAPHEPLLFHNAKPGQANTRKYIGVIFQVGNFSYFAPLSSFKPKHAKMKESIDFLKVGRYAVIDINNMFPVPNGVATRVTFSNVSDPAYHNLLLAEYRIIKKRQNLITKNAQIVYNLKITKPNNPISKRCNNFKLLEQLCQNYQP